MSATKTVLWLLMAIAVIAIICEGIYRLLGNGTLARIICTIALIAVAPFLVKPFIYREHVGKQADVEKADGQEPADGDK